MNTTPTDSPAQATDIDNTRLALAVRWSCLAFIFLQPLAHVGAMRQITTLALAVSLTLRIVLELRSRCTARLGTGFVRWWWLLVGWALLSSLASPYTGDSLDAMRKGLLPQVLLLMVILLEFSDPRWQLRLLRAFAYGLGVATLLAATETLLTRGALLNGGLIPHGSFLKGYANQAVILMPMALCLGFHPDAHRHERRLVIATLIAGAALVVLYNSRTALVALTLGTGGALLLLGNWKRALWLLGAIAVAGLLAAQTHLINVDKYRSLLSGNTYVSDSGLSYRLSLWQGTLDMVGARPLAGYGYGWKKYADVMVSGGFLAEWRTTRPRAAEFYALDGRVPGYGGANPHNLGLQIAFELGLVGVLLYLALWCSWLRNDLSTVARRRPGDGRLLLICSTGAVLGFVLINLTNGYWEGSIANLMLGWLCLIHVTARRPPLTLPLDAGFKGRILVIRRDNIGDLVCTTPLLRQLRSHYPNAWLGALVSRYNAPVLENNPDLDGIYSYVKGKHRASGESALGIHVARLLQLLELRRMSIDIVLLPASGSQLSARQMARWIGARTIIAQPDDATPALHEVERAARVLQPLGITGTPPAQRLVADVAGFEKVRHRIADTLPDKGTLVGIHISARKPDQRWPAQHYAEFMNRLHAEQGTRFMLFWSPGDEDNPLHPGDDRKAAAVIAACQAPLLPWPTQSLRELIDGLAACGSVVCSDGGAMHLAAALGKPIVCSFGSSDPVRWHPWAVPHRVLRADSRTVADITVDEALAAWKGLCS